jgi:hypothetical protein
VQNSTITKHSLYKVKRPGGVYTFVDLRLVAADDHGIWLFGATGTRWHAPHDAGALPFDALVLVDPAAWWVTFWVDDTNDRRVEIDICLPPERCADGWSYVDLELDPVRHANGDVEVQDRDEFAAACANGYVTPADADAAIHAAARMERALREAREPWGETGWQRLAAARRP